ncbi:L-serine kinase SerK [Pyrococcus yayanosii]|uniref:ParB-like nuclease, putative n=1 Tax=Pyrococcus yayanosii (strain CH1 / JCM 16557) TaxID=529709 RepID=F8AEH4_PYRYC|nr:L-serine kinase SerK [Pyrococcus yayanosii]AEH25564.1 parB-like nuclease, putative [Pyrococcus yayanosii CH1]
MGVEKVPKYDIPVKKVEFVFVELDKMKPHEQLVQRELEDFIESVTGSGIFWKPMLLAKIPGTDEYLIVDGHHRWAGLQKLGAKRAPSVILDYFDEGVKVYTWYPAFRGDLEKVIEKLKAEGLDVVEDPEAEEKAERGEIAFALVGKRSFAIPGGLEEQKKVSKVLDEMDQAGEVELVYYGLKEDAKADMAKGEIDYVFIRKAPTKEEVMELVKRGEVFSPKTTRHVLPFIPDKIDVKLEDLF